MKRLASIAIVVGLTGCGGGSSASPDTSAVATGTIIERL